MSAPEPLRHEADLAGQENLFPPRMAQLRSAIVALPAPTLGLKGGVDRAAVLHLIDEATVTPPPWPSENVLTQAIPKALELNDSGRSIHLTDSERARLARAILRALTPEAAT